MVQKQEREVRKVFEKKPGFPQEGGLESKMGVEENTEPFNEEEFPFPLTAVDRHNLSITDAEFKPHTWAELKHIIGARPQATSVHQR